MIGIDQLVIGRRRFRQDADPAERIFAIVDPERIGGNARPANAVKAVAAGDEIAIELLEFALLAKANAWPAGLELMDADVIHLEKNDTAVGEAPRDQVFDDLLLA